MWKELRNKDRNPDNTFHALKSEIGCCGDDQTPCKYSVTHDFSTGIKSVSVNGTVHALANTATSGTEFKDELAALLEGLGYADVDLPNGTKVTNTTGTTWDVEVVSEAVIDKLVNASDVDVSVTAECVQIAVCDFKVTLAGGPLSPVAYDGSSNNLDNDPYAYTGTPATDESTASTLATDVASELTALSVPYKSVEVTVNDTAGGYDILVRMQYGTVVSIDGTELEFCKNCQNDFKA